MRVARLQFVLLALIAALSLACYFASVSGQLEEIYGHRVARSPTSHGLHLQAVSGLTPEAESAGIHWGDRVLAINGLPFTGYNVMLKELRRSHAGDLMRVTIQPGSAMEAPRIVSVRLALATPTRPGVFETISRILFLFLIFPLGCLLLGVWVVAAKPRDWNAWFLLGILQYFVDIFAGNQFWPSPVAALTGVWAPIGLTAGPLCIMLFGIYFPERSRFDVAVPWFKWLLTAFLIALLPLELLYNLGFLFSFQSIAWLAPHVGSLFRLVTLGAMVAISIYFFCLGEKAGTAQSPGVKRRLRILYAGSTIGNGPMFMLVLYSIFTDRDLGRGLPEWVFLGALFVFTLFPISLAYVVVVHRAMDLRILVRQGTKYALARMSLWTLRVVTGYLLVTAALRAFGNRSAGPIEFLLLIGLAAFLWILRVRSTKLLSSWIDRKFFREAYSAEQVLGELAAQAQGFTETTPLIRTVSECIANALHVERIAVLLRSGDTFRLQYAVGIELGGDLMLNGNSKTIANLDLVKSPASVYLDHPDSWLLAATEAERSALRELGAEMLIPLRGRNRLIGVMALGPKRSEEPYSKIDRGLLQSVALHTGLSIENSELVHSLAAEAAQRERIHQEIEIAREVQERFLPQSYPVVPGLELAGACRPAQGVGGDYYDFISMKRATAANGDRPHDAPLSLGIAIGDVSGKGISAALLMASLRASLHGLTRNNDGDLAAMMGEVNDLVYEASASNRYATFFFAQFDPTSRQLTYVNAGHNAPAVLRRSRQPNGTGDVWSNNGFEIIRLDAGGPVVGLLEVAVYEQTTITLRSGDIMLAFTDGISEAMTFDGEEWNEERLIECLTTFPELSAAAMVNCLMEAADAFAAGAPQHDDMTLLVLKLQTISDGSSGPASAAVPAGTSL